MSLIKRSVGECWLTTAMKSDMRRTTRTRLCVGTLTATWIALNVHVTTRNGITICTHRRHAYSRRTHSSSWTVAVYRETHCKIGSNRAFPTSVLDGWQLFTYLLTYKLFSSCFRRFLVSRACDWVVPALSAVLRIFTFQFSVLFTARRHASAGISRHRMSVCLSGTRTVGLHTQTTKNSSTTDAVFNDQLMD